MKTLLARLLTVFLLTLPGFAKAQTGPVVVELFTSQGCSSCPPADDYLASLLGREDILPLALHVNYWDRLGWKDTFATPEYTDRQYAYGRAFKNRSVWTPQFVVGGAAYSKGSFRDLIPAAVTDYSAQKVQVQLTAAQSGDKVSIKAEPLVRDLPKMLISLVGYAPKETVKIKRGENAGRTITYHNIVRSWVDVANWNGSASKSYSAPVIPGLNMAVIVQADGHGPILAAARVK